MAMALPPVGVQTPSRQRQDPGRQMRHAHPRQNQEAGVVHHQWQTPPLLRWQPTDPSVARLALEGSGCPSQQCQPCARLVDGNLAQMLPDHAAGAQVVMLDDQGVPTRRLGPADHLNPHASQIHGAYDGWLCRHHAGRVMPRVPKASELFNPQFSYVLCRSRQGPDL